MRTAVLLLVATLSGNLHAADLVAPTDPLPPEVERTKFHLPPGFEIQLVACEPDIHKPMNLRFDAAGRLYVTHSIEYPFPAAEGQGRDAVTVFSDIGPDGRAKKATVLVDKLNIPIGVLPIPGGVIVHSIPNVYRVVDGQREPILKGIGHDDTHGMPSSFTRWLDGWVYACHGFRNDSTVVSAGGQTLHMQSGNTYRFLPDGSKLEQWTHGQVNPFGLCFDELGNLYSADCHSMPVYLLLRGAYYPSFGKPHDGLGYGPTMIDHNHGSTGIGGIAYYYADQYPAEYQRDLYIGNVVTGRVHRDKLEWHGSTPKVNSQPDFVTCDDPWFHPVAVELGPDGALYIADFYNRIIGHYEVPLTHPGSDRERGRIWRVIYKGDGSKPAPTPPDISHMTLKELIALTGNSNLALATMAVHQIVDRFGKDAAEPVKQAWASQNPLARAHLLWVLERLGALDERTRAAAASDDSPLVRVHLLKLLGGRERWTAAEFGLVNPYAVDEDAFVRRAFADAVGHRTDRGMAGLLAGLLLNADASDTHLIHTVRIALRDQMRDGDVFGWVVNQAREHADLSSRVADVCLGLPTPQAASFLLQTLEANPRRGAWPEELRHAIRYLDEADLAQVQGLLASYRELPPEDQATAIQAAWKAMDERGAKPPEAWRAWAIEAATALLARGEEDAGLTAITLTKDLKLEEMTDALAAAARQKKTTQKLRVKAMDAIAAASPTRGPAVLGGVLGDTQVSANVRVAAAEALARSTRPAARSILLANLPGAPSRVATAIASALAGSAAGSLALIETVEAGKAPALVLTDSVVDRKLRDLKSPTMAERVKKLTAALPPADQRLITLIEERRAAFGKAKPSVERGKVAFTQFCAVCHQVGGQGGRVGPGLDGIGVRGIDRLLEDVLDPNRAVDPMFRAVTVQTRGGQTLTGLGLREEGAMLVLTDVTGTEQRVAAGEVETRTVSNVSLMPPTFGDAIPPEVLNDLMAYLLTQAPPR